MTDLIVNGKSIREFGNIYLANIERPAMPKRRVTEVTLMGRDGSYKFWDGYEDRSIKMDLVMVGINEELKRFILRELVEYMQGDLILQFTDEMDITYKATLVDMTDLKEMNVREVCSLEFVAESKQASFEENNIILDSHVKLAEKIKLDTNLDTQFSITSNRQIEIENLGSKEIRPMIEISGSATSINLGGFTISNISSTVYIDTIYIDVDKMICYTISGNQKVNKIKDTNGKFEVLRLNTGTNNISISGTNMNLNVKYKFRNQYL